MNYIRIYIIMISSREFGDTLLRINTENIVNPHKPFRHISGW